MESPLSVPGQKFSEASSANSAAERLCPFRDLCAQAWSTPSPTMCEDHNKQGYFLNGWKVVPSAIWTNPYWLSIFMWGLNIISLKFQRHGLRGCYSLYMSLQSLGQEYVKLSFAVVSHGLWVRRTKSGLSIATQWLWDKRKQDETRANWCPNTIGNSYNGLPLSPYALTYSCNGLPLSPHASLRLALGLWPLLLARPHLGALGPLSSLHIYSETCLYVYIYLFTSVSIYIYIYLYFLSLPTASPLSYLCYLSF